MMDDKQKVPTHRCPRSPFRNAGTRGRSRCRRRPTGSSGATRCVSALPLYPTLWHIITTLLIPCTTPIRQTQKRAKHRRRMDTVGAAFIGLVVGAFVALASNSLAPALRRRWAERGGRAYSGSLDREGGGIEASGRVGGTV